MRPEPFRELETGLSGYRPLSEGRLDRFGVALAKKCGELSPPKKEPGR